MRGRSRPARRREGSIVEVISRAHESIVGRYYEENGIGFVVADNPKIQQEVLVTYKALPVRALVSSSRSRSLTGLRSVSSRRATSVEVIGNYMAPGMEIDVALRS